MTETVRDLMRRRIEEIGGFGVAAEKLGCTREHLYQLLNNNHRLPSLEMAAQIDALLGVPMAAWTTDDAA